MGTRTLKTAVFLGSARNVSPPWGGDARLGTRVIEYVKKTLASRASPLGKSDVGGAATTLRCAVSVACIHFLQLQHRARRFSFPTDHGRRASRHPIALPPLYTCARISPSGAFTHRA